MSPQTYVDEVIVILKRVNAGKNQPITAQTSILTELDLDSLKMIELAEALKDKYGVDFFTAPHSMDDLRTPGTIAAALDRVRSSCEET